MSRRHRQPTPHCIRINVAGEELEAILDACASSGLSVQAWIRATIASRAITRRRSHSVPYPTIYTRPVRKEGLA
jgi:hypothetical protein